MFLSVDNEVAWWEDTGTSVPLLEIDGKQGR